MPPDILSSYVLHYGYLTLGGKISDSEGTYDTTTGPGGVILPLDNWLRIFAHAF
jgi:hypothetical protein